MTEPMQTRPGLIYRRQHGVAFPELVIVAVLEVAPRDFLSGLWRKKAPRKSSIFRRLQRSIDVEHSLLAIEGDCRSLVRSTRKS